MGKVKTSASLMYLFHFCYYTSHSVKTPMDKSITVRGRWRVF